MLLRHLLVTTVSIVVALPILPAQGPPAPVLDTACLAAADVGLHPMPDGSWCGLGPDYQVRFDAEQFTFLPLLGAAAPHDMPLTMTTTHVGRGDLRAVGPAQRRPGERHVDYDRPEVRERLELLPAGLKQSFVFATLPPGRGDLVVRTRIVTPLAADAIATSGELRLGDEATGGIRIGQVVGIDAAGRRATGSMRLAGTTLDFVLPAAFVEQAALPLVVDPLLATITGVTAFAFEDRAPDVAWLDGANLFLVVFRRTASAQNHDLRALRVDLNGSFVGAVFPVEITSADAEAPRVAPAGSGNWLVVWEQAGAIRGARITPTAVVDPFLIASSTATLVTPTIAGDVVSPRAVAVWRNSTGNRLEVATLQVLAGSIVAVGPATPLVTGTSFTVVDQPAASRANHGGKALLAYHQNSVLLLQQSVRALELDIPNGTAGASFPVAGGATHALRPACAGDGKAWVVAYETNSATAGETLSCTSVRTANGQVELGAARSLTAPGTASANPDVAWLAGSVLVAWTQPNGARNDVLLASIDPFTLGDCEGTVVADPLGDDDTIAIAATAGPNSGSLDRAAIAYVENQTNTAVRLRHFAAADGTQFVIGGGCGAGGDAYATSARIGNAGFGFQMLAAPAGELSLLVLSPTLIPNGFQCGPCRVHPDLGTGIVAFTGITSPTGAARYDLPIPLQPALAGQLLVGQFVRLGSNCLGAFDLGDAISVQIQN